MSWYDDCFDHITATTVEDIVPSQEDLRLIYEAQAMEDYCDYCNEYNREQLRDNIYGNWWDCLAGSA